MCKINGLIASAYLFCPQIIQVKDYIFIKQFWNCSKEESLEQIGKLEKQYCNDKKAIEILGKDLMGEFGLCITMYEVDI